MPEITLFQGDNLSILVRHIKDESVDLIYLDPPFNSNQNFNLLSHTDKGSEKINQNKAYQDTWRWDDAAINNFDLITEEIAPELKDALWAFRHLLGESDRLSYIVMMSLRLRELHRVLKRSGSIYLHCDQSASSYIRSLMDVIFGPKNFLNCISWCYGLGGSSHRYWPRKHDDILWYSKSVDKHYFEAVQIPATSQRMKGKTKKAPDYWNIPTINNMAHERNGYPTQKPEKLLEMIILSSSQVGDLILDPCCGSGTTLAIASKLNRRAIGIDSSETAIKVCKKRFAEQIIKDTS